MLTGNSLNNLSMELIKTIVCVVYLRRLNNKSKFSLNLNVPREQASKVGIGVSRGVLVRTGSLSTLIVAVGKKR